MARGRFRGDVSQGVHLAPLLVRLGPKLPDRLPEARRPVGCDERRGVQAALDEIAGQTEATPRALAAAEGQAEQDLSALQGDAPGDQHPFGRLVVGVQLEVKGVEEQVDDVVALESPGAPAPVALTGVLEDAREPSSAS